LVAVEAKERVDFLQASAKIAPLFFGENMKLPFSLFLAFKYLKPKRSLVSVITVITMLGMMFGVGVLIVVLAVMTGFDDMHKEHMIKLDSHIQVKAQGNYSFDPVPVLAALDQISGITAAAPAVEGFVMMSRNGQAITAALRGIDPEREKRITDIEQYLIDGELALDEETVVLGNRLAMNLRTWVGDTLTLYSPQCFVSEDELRLPMEVTVAGIFSVGMYDVDSQYMISSLRTARDVFNVDGGVQTLRLITTDPYRVPEMSEKINAAILAASKQSKELGWMQRLKTETWMEIHSALISTLKTEKDMMFILLCGISIVATFSVTNALITLCVQKTNEIGLLKALGFSSRNIVNTFIMLGAVQGFFGCMWGVVFGILVSRNLDAILNFFRRFNPGLMSAEFYQFSQMPSRVLVSDVLLVCTIVMFFSTLSGALPAWWASRMKPVDALRYE
jgi:lipoprotein-releasing system permease protein